MSVKESEKLKEKAPKKFEKEGIGSTSAYFGFPKGTWQWRKYLVKIRRKYKAISTKNQHDNSVRGEIVFKFHLIDNGGAKKFFYARKTFFFSN